MTNIKKNMIEASVHIKGSRVEGKEGRGRAIERSIGKGSEHRAQVRPSAELMSLCRRTSIASAVRIVVPVTYEKIKGGKVKGLKRKGIKEMSTMRMVSGGIDIGDRERATLVAESRR